MVGLLASSWGAGETATLVAAAVAAAVSLVGIWINGLRRERQRRRQLYSDALAATYEYREFAYVVRRRQARIPAEERIRISEAMRVVQKEIDHHRTLLDLERTDVAAAYRELVGETRRIVGGLIRDSWANDSGIETDAEMNIADMDLGGLDAAVERYTEAVRRDLRWSSLRY